MHFKFRFCGRGGRETDERSEKEHPRAAAVNFSWARTVTLLVACRARGCSVFGEEKGMVVRRLVVSDGRFVARLLVYCVHTQTERPLYILVIAVEIAPLWEVPGTKRPERVKGGCGPRRKADGPDASTPRTEVASAFEHLTLRVHNRMTHCGCGFAVVQRRGRARR